MVEKRRKMQAAAAQAASTGSADTDALINHIPDGVLLMVFYYLDSKALLTAAPAVCRWWRRVCAEMMPAVNLDVSWATPDRLGMENPLTDAGLNGLISRFRIVQGANLARCKQVTDVGIERLAAGCPNLSHLDLNGCKQVTDVWIERLAAGCPNLNHLDLNGCNQVTDVGIERLAAGCPNLSHLYLFDCKVTDVGVERFALVCPNCEIGR